MENLPRWKDCGKLCGKLLGIFHNFCGKLCGNCGKVLWKSGGVENFGENSVENLLKFSTTIVESYVEKVFHRVCGKLCGKLVD